MMQSGPLVSVIIPCRNEVGTIRQVLDDLEAQTWQGSFEVIIADGRSEDGTVSLLAAQQQMSWSFSLQVIDNPQLTIPAGLNAAVRVAKGQFIVRVDGHCRLAPDYLTAIHHALAEQGNDVVGPRIVQVPGAHTLVARAISSLLATPLGTGGTPSRGQIWRTKRVVHTVMSCYRREVWERLGGYDETLLSNEDFDFDWRAHKAGAMIASLPTPVFQLLSRSTFGALLRQRWRYGFWKAAVLTKDPSSLLLRQMLPVIGLCMLAVSWALSPVVAGWLLVLYGVCAGFAAVRAVITQQLGWPTAMFTCLSSPLIYGIIHAGWTAGLLVGLICNRYQALQVSAQFGSLVSRCPRLPGHPRVAVIHDWLETCGGSEHVLAEILNCLPEARLFSLVDFRDQRTDFLLHGRLARTTFLQSLPWARRYFRFLLPIMPLAIEQLDLADYDLVISSSHAVAKGVIVRPYGLHVCYCHSPLRYAWDQQHHYDRLGALGRGPKRWFTLVVLHWLRAWDATSAARVDRFIANSTFVAERISRYYRRDSVVIPPPVKIDRFALSYEKKKHYILVSRLVPYKCPDIVVDAFAQMPDRSLLVIGDGPELKRLKRSASANIQFMGWQSDEVVAQHLAQARAFVFAGEEDFGIVKVESLASGTPVIAFARGGARDTIIDGLTGILFSTQSPEGVVDAIQRFESLESTLIPAGLRRHAERFSVNNFRSSFLRAIAEMLPPRQGKTETDL